MDFIEAFGQTPLRIGSRTSKLAIALAEMVKKTLLQKFPSLSVEIITIKASGDYVPSAGDWQNNFSKISTEPLNKVTGIFTKELENALLENRIDLAVHSTKDLPAFLHSDMELISALERGSPWDALVGDQDIANSDKSTKVPSVVHMFSPRRKAQWLYFYPWVEQRPVRGNIDNRISYLQYAAQDQAEKSNSALIGMVLAASGLDRIGFKNYLPLNDLRFLPAPCQGIIGIEVLKKNSKYEIIKKICDAINHSPTFEQMNKERQFLQEVGFGCQNPVGVFSDVSGDFYVQYFEELGKKPFELKTDSVAYAVKEFNKSIKLNKG